MAMGFNSPRSIKTIAKEVVLAYPDFTKPFEIYQCVYQTTGSGYNSGQQAYYVLQFGTLWHAI
jgi:hypothetical protein